MTDHVQWLREQAGGPMSRNPEHVDTCNRLAEIADELGRLRGKTGVRPYGADAVVRRPDKVGLYYLHNAADHLIYVGQSMSFLQRLSGHYDKPWAAAYVRYLPPDILSICESLEIRRYLPPLNGNLGPSYSLAGSLEQWWGFLPTVEFALEHREVFAVLDELCLGQGAIWLEDDGEIGVQVPRRCAELDIARAVAFVQSRLSSAIEACSTHEMKFAEANR